MGFGKGTQESMDHMAKMRAMRGGNKKTSISNQISSTDNNNNIEQVPKRGGRLIKGSQAAKEYMQLLRSKRR